MDLKKPTEERLQHAAEICSTLLKQIKITEPTGFCYRMKKWQEDRKRLDEEEGE